MGWLLLGEGQSNIAPITMAKQLHWTPIHNLGQVGNLTLQTERSVMGLGAAVSATVVAHDSIMIIEGAR
jgi:hypothetical protein